MGFNKLNTGSGFGGNLEYIAEYQSAKTGLRVLLANCRSGGIYRLEIAIPTAGSSDKGEPHCLEHLCFRGCERVPISGLLDSIPALSQGSNAFTCTDRTVYTLSTASVEGMLRMLPVYLEHIHYPLLSDEDKTAQASFATEVFHINDEYQNAGVVYSEMEAAMSEPLDIATYATLKAAYPEDCCYRWNTGGDPAAIPNLTPAEVRMTHDYFYSASNTTVVLTGPNLNPDSILRVLEEYEDEQYLPQQKGRFETGPVLPWSPTVSPEIPSGIQIVTHSPSEHDSGDHFVSYSFRLKFPWSDTKRRLALDIALCYFVEGSGAILNKRFVEGPDAYAGSVDMAVEPMLWSLVMISFTDVDSARSLTMAREVTSTIRSHMADDFDMSRLRAIVQRELWKAESQLESAPGKAVIDQLVSYAVNCASSNEGCASTDLMHIVNEVPVYAELLHETETFWRAFIRSTLELSEKYVIVVKPSEELSRKKSVDRKLLAERRQAENVQTFSVKRSCEALEADRRQNLTNFMREYSKKNAPLLEVNTAVLPECSFSKEAPELKPAVWTSSFTSAFTNLTLTVHPGASLDHSLKDIMQNPKLQEAYKSLGIDKFVAEITQFEYDEDMTDAIKDLHKNPNWDRALASSSEDEDDSSDDEDGSSEPHGAGDESSDDAGEDYAEDLGSLESDECAEIVKYQRDQVTRALLAFVLQTYSAKHLLHILSKCIFYCHICLSPAVDFHREILQLISLEAQGDESVTITPEELETFLNSRFLEYDASNGFEASHAFNELLSITIKAPAESVFVALKTLSVILLCTKISPNRLEALARRELSYITTEFRQGETVASELHDIQTYGRFQSSVTSQLYILQNVLLRSIVCYPEVFAPLLNYVLEEAAFEVYEGRCLLYIAGNTRACNPCGDNPKVLRSFAEIFPRWLSPEKHQVPSFPAISSLKNATCNRLSLNVQWNDIDVGIVECAAALPESTVAAECGDTASHLIFRHNEKLMIVESYLIGAEGPVFQPVRDAGGAYVASMWISEESRTVQLSLRECSDPRLALQTARDSLAKLTNNCELLLRNSDAQVEFPTREHFAQAKSATLYQMAKELEDPTSVAEAQLDNALRGLDNDWMFAKVSAVDFMEFVRVLRDVCQPFVTNACDITAVSNSFLADRLQTECQLPAPAEYIGTVVKALLPEGPEIEEQLLSVALKARISVLSSSQ